MNTIIRKLKYSDRRRLSTMVKMLVEKTGDDGLLKLVSASNSENTEGSEPGNGMLLTGIQILKQMLDVLENETCAWFADLLGVTVEEFEKEAPLDIEIQIVNQLTDAVEVNSFFSGASQLFKKIKEYQSKFSDGKEK